MRHRSEIDVNAAPAYDRRAGADDKTRVSVPANTGIQRFVWEGRFGLMRIDIVGDQTFVNGKRVEPVPP